MRDTVMLAARLASNARIAVIGDVMLDENINGAVSRISPEAPVILLNKGQTRNLAGGCANVVAGILALGAHCTVLGVVGDDAGATHIVDALKRAGKGTFESQLVTDASRPTTVKTRYWASGHGATHYVFRVDHESLEPVRGGVLDELLRRISMLRPRPDPQGYDALVISDYAKGVITPEIVDAVRSTGIPIIAAPKPQHGTLFTGVRVLLPNFVEARAIAKTLGIESHDAQNLARTLQAALTRNGDVPHLVMTLGKDGIMGLLADGTIVRESTVAREIYDVTGAGDTVLAVFGTCFASGMSLPDCIRIANTAGGIKVGKVGVSTVTFDEIRAGTH